MHSTDSSLAAPPVPAAPHAVGGEHPPAPFSSPEMELLICCARRELTPEHRERVRAIVQSGVDWTLFGALAVRHKMLPLVWAHLAPERAVIPEASVRDLHLAFVNNATQMLRASAELLELAAIFTEQGIPMVPYKGPVLGARVYGNLALRQAGDLDVLVRQRDVPRARALLLECGYRARHALGDWATQLLSRRHHSEEFDRAGSASVELHWAFANGDIGLPLSLEMLAPRLRTAELAGRQVPIFDDEDLLLILCVHGGNHRWDRLEWLCSVSELLRASDVDLDWDGLVDRATRLGVRRMLLLGLLLADALLDAPVPPPIVRSARADGVLVRLADEVPRLLVNDPVNGGRDGVGDLATDLFRLRLRERYRDQARFLWFRLTTPSRPESWTAVPIGKYRLPIHVLLRPFQVGLKLLSAHPRVARTVREQ